tara:strand:- start:380 stop:850 length:471 start_codon:yes stop_codon:yes gene_type:complete
MAEKIAQRAASRENARRIMNSPAEEYNLFSEILMRGRERGGFTKDEMLVLEEAGFLDNIRTFDEDFISPEPPDEYYEALNREEEEKEAARKKENMIRFGEEDPPARGMPFRWEFKGFTPEGKKQYRKVPGYPKSKIKDLERGPDQFFDIYASKRMT